MRRRSVLLGLILLVAGFLGAASPARAEPMTFHLTVGDALASVGHANAFLVSLGEQARGLNLVPGGTRSAGLSCAGLGAVYKLGAVTVLDGPGALPDLFPTTKRGGDPQALATAFGLAGLTLWVPPATDAETDQKFWSATSVAHGLRFAAEALVTGSNAGLLNAGASAGIFRFRANVQPAQVAGASYRFLVELVGRTASRNAGRVAFAKRCVTFVDLVPVDIGALRRLVDETLEDPSVLYAFATRVPRLETVLARHDFVTAFDVMAYMIGYLVRRSPENAPPATARRVVTGVFDVRRGLDFRPATAECGNGSRETGEACDGADLDGFTCNAIGYDSGSLICQPSCLFDFSGCVANSVCGNGVIEINEECDSGAQNSDSIPGACRTNCKLAFCGDHVIDVFESCEGNNLNGETCKTLGYDGGSLRCDPVYCEFDDERCAES